MNTLHRREEESGVRERRKEGEREWDGGVCKGF